MKKIIFISAIFLSLIQMYSCKKDLNVTPVDQFSDASVWADPSLTQTFVNNIYGGIPHGFSNINMGSLVDESVYNAGDGSFEVLKSLITPDNLYVFDSKWGSSPGTTIRSWGTGYKYVRACDLFFEKIDNVPFD